MKPLDISKKKKLIHNVYSLVGSVGLAGVTVAELCKASGLGVGSFYTYFAGKDELLQEAYKELAARNAAEVYADINLHADLKSIVFEIFFKALANRLRNHDEAVFADQYIQSNLVQLNKEEQLANFRKQNEMFFAIMKAIVPKRASDEEIFLMVNFFDGAIRSASNVFWQKLVPLNRKNIIHYYEMAFSGLLTLKKQE